jgi:acyl carrier protein
MQDLGVDSVNMTSIVAQLQATYGFHMESDELIELFNAPRIADFVALVRKAIHEAGQGGQSATSVSS